LSSIEKFISPFIQQQFPSFYKTEGPNFIAFVKAYYEWLEQDAQAIGHARSLLNYRDIDVTQEQFIKYFKSELMSKIPESIVTDKRLLLKHITDLYKAKGSKRAYELLFRIVFGEDIDVYVPNEYIFKPSDNVWKVPRYIEVTSHPNLNQLAGTQIQNTSNTASAVVENVSSKIANDKTINILELSSIRGEFSRGDRVYQTSEEFISLNEAIRITGSLTAVAISQGGTDYSVGDLINVLGESGGIDAKGRVSSVIDGYVGALQFTIGNGGSGYTTNAVVSVTTTLNLNITGQLGFINSGDVVTDSVTGANGSVVFSNSSAVSLIGFSTSPSFQINGKLLGPFGNATITRVIGGTGFDGNFNVGSITNKEIISYNNTLIDSYLTLNLDSLSNTLQIAITGTSGVFSVSDTVQGSANVLHLEGITVTPNNITKGESLSNTTLGISNLFVYRSDESLVFCTGTDSNLTNANLVAGTILISNTTSSVFQLINKPVKQQSIANAAIASVNATSIVVNLQSGYFVQSSTITDITSSATATISDVVRLTDWNLQGSISNNDNLDTLIQNGLALTTVEVGTIASLSQVNPGLNYLTTPYITVVEPEIASLYLLDSNLTQKGNNAIITSTISGSNGAITGIEITDSGFGYSENENLTLVSNTNPSIARGISIVYKAGKGQGKWLNRKSFSSDEMYIQDGFFYQNYSYQIIAERMLSSYETLVRDLIHPAGIALFGAYRAIDYVNSDTDVIVQSSILQQ
jgi:hypothetical protein